MPEYTATVSKDLEDLIPVFLKNRHKDIETLRSALAASDFEQLRQIGHRMKGVGNSYGFAEVSNIGKTIEDSAKAGNRETLDACVAAYAEYLANVKIVYE